MEKMSIHHLGLFMDSDIVLLKEEVKTFLPESKEVAEEILELLYEGNFEKGILIIYEGNHLEPALREFLFKILQAVNCSLKDVALSASESVEEIPMQTVLDMSPNKVVVFGKLHHDLTNLKKHAYEITNEDGVEYLFVDSVQEISGNVPLKKSLWEKLQVLFNIKN